MFEEIKNIPKINNLGPLRGQPDHAKINLNMSNCQTFFSNGYASFPQFDPHTEQ